MRKLLNRYITDSGRVKAFITGFLKAFILLFLFYRTFLFSIVLAVIFGFVNIRFDAKRRREEWRWQMNLEFREVMTGLSTALNAGYSIENAFKEAKEDLLLLYGENSVMVKELDVINSKLVLNQPLEIILMEFAGYCGVEDINNFAEVFQTAKRTGGNMIDVARSTADKISSKIEVSREIRTMIAGKQMEGRIMTLIPLAIIIYFWISSPDFLNCLYSVSGRPVMTVLLIIYVAAYKWSERIGDITV